MLYAVCLTALIDSSARFLNRRARALILLYDTVAAVAAVAARTLVVPGGEQRSGVRAEVQIFREAETGRGTPVFPSRVRGDRRRCRQRDRPTGGMFVRDFDSLEATKRRCSWGLFQRKFGGGLTKTVLS